MTDTVLKAFTTNVHRFALGDTVPDDADLSPHTATDLRSRHFIGDEHTKAASKAVRTAEKSDAN